MVKMVTSWRVNGEDGKGEEEEEEEEEEEGIGIGDGDGDGMVIELGTARAGTRQKRR